MPDNDDAGRKSGDAGDADQSQKGEAAKGGTDAGSKGDQDTLSKDKVEEIVQARLASERKKYADYDDLKTKAAEFDKIQESQKSEIEKATEARTAAEREREEVRTELQNERIRNAVYARAAEARVSPKAAFKLIDQSAIDFDDDGLPDDKSVAKAFDAMLNDYPELSSSRRPQGDAGGGQRGGSSDSSSSGDSWIRRGAGVS